MITILALNAKLLTALLGFSGVVEGIAREPDMWGSGSRGSTTNRHGFSALRAIVTGLQHSGTTVTSKMLYNAPCVIGAGETGFLAAETPADIRKLKPYMKWHMNMTKETWYMLEPSDVDAMTDAKDFPQMLDVLREKSHIFNKLIDEPWCDKPYQMIDKTPRYVRPEIFERILNMTHGARVPVVVLKKSYKSLKASWAKRGKRGMTTHKYYHTYRNVERMIRKYPNRIMVVNWDDMLLDVESVMQEVFHFAGLEWRTEYLKMTNLKKKFANYGNDVLNWIAMSEWHSTKTKQGSRNVTLL